MSQQKEIFLKESENRAFDSDYRKIVDFNMSRYEKSFRDGEKQYLNLDIAKERAARIKYSVTNELEHYLKEFEMNYIKNGGQLIWAEDAKSVLETISKIIKLHNVKNVVKSKSTVTEEIGLNKYLGSIGVESLETDIGAYIMQVSKEKPFHIVSSAINKSKEDISALFQKKFDTKKDLNPEEITLFTRKKLRNKLLYADMGITGADFLIADTGSIAISENEGNAALSVSAPKIHIAIVGLEKVIPSIKNLDLFWSLLSSHSTGQNVSVYNTIVGGPKKANESDGPSQQYVILLDNGRTKLLATEHQQIALSCIKCGACSNVCPVFKTVGGNAYDSVYSGPIGAIINPHMFGMEEYNHLSFASTLCGKCNDVCPVNIPLTDLLLYNRRDAVAQGKTSGGTSFLIKAYKLSMKKRWILETLSPRIKNIGTGIIFRKGWGKKRELPKFKPSFAKRWKTEHPY